MQELWKLSFNGCSLRLMIKLNGYEIKPTIFPDHTSQVWKVPEQYFGKEENTITWEFEHEGELMHVAQLKYLLDFKWGWPEVVLEVPYLPYARQDKPVSNETTFALMPFFNFLNILGFSKIKVVDPHNVELVQKCLKDVDIQRVDKLIAWHLQELNALPVYPDTGASKRYHVDILNEENKTKAIIGEKDRDPLTGEIKGVKLTGTVESCTYLIVDDLADGGKTFIEVSKLLYTKGAKTVHLYVSHGLFSKGLEPLRAAGIQRIFTYKGEVDTYVTV